jgi:hypothetical protein
MPNGRYKGSWRDYKDRERSRTFSTEAEALAYAQAMEQAVNGTVESVPKHELRLSTAKELSVVLNVPRNTIYANAKKFGWPCYRVGADIRFDMQEILALIRQEPGA